MVWKWRIWVSVGIRNKLPESPPICFQMDFQLLWIMLVYISAEFRRVRNRPILTKNPGLYPMVLNMADLGKCWDSFQTPWISSYVLAKAFQLLSRMLVKISGEFRRVQNRPILTKKPGYSPCFWTWWISVSVGNRSKLPETPAVCLKMDFEILSTMLVKISGEFQRVRNGPILTGWLQNLPKSAMFKTMGYSPRLLLKIGRFRLIGNSSKIVSNKPVRS